MRKTPVCALVLLLSGCAHRAPLYRANLEPATPWSEADCAHLTPLFVDWQDRLGLRDWTIVYSCEKRHVTDSDGMITLGETYPYTSERRAEIWISPAAPDQAEIVLHELLHLVITFAREADSELVEEQQVRTLTLLLHPPKPSAPEGPKSFVGRDNQ